MQIGFISCGLIIIMALIYDTDGTIKLVGAAVGVRGVTWLVKKITNNINFDASQIIDFAGWSIAGVSIVKIISNAMGSVVIIRNAFNKVGQFFDKVNVLIDKITF